MDGNELEKQVKDILQKDGWQVSTGAYYKDSSTKKPREKDIIATFPQFNNEEILSYNVRLFIECKCLPETTEIYSENINTSEIENTVLVYNIPFADISEIERNRQTHFYEYAEIFGQKDKGDFLYPAINQNLQSFDAFRKNNPERGLYYLIVVYDGELISMDKKGNRKSCNNALVKIETLDNVFNLPHKKCFIELVSVGQLENLLKKIREDIGKINSSAGFYYRMEKNKIDENRRKTRDEKISDYGL